MKWIPYKKRSIRPKESGEYIVRYYADKFCAVQVVESLIYNVNEGGFMAEHSDIYNLEWLDESDTGWTSVKEGLPSKNGYYICWCGTNEPGLIHYHKNTGWGNGFYNEGVTHWFTIIPPCQ